MKPEITIDVGSVTDRNELHTLLSQKLGFPDYYGMNWDAFDECIRDFVPTGTIHITGINHLERVLEREAHLLKQSLEEYKEESQNDRDISIS